jgi:hypothetical protein
MSPEPEISRVTSDERNVPTQGVLERLFALAMEVLGNEANVLAWLKTPHAVWGVKPTTSSARCNFFDGERDDRSVSKNRWIRNAEVYLVCAGETAEVYLNCASTRSFERF